MRDKLQKYANEVVTNQNMSAGLCKWRPLTGRILDPVRASVVCSGADEMLQVVSWFTGEECKEVSDVQNQQSAFSSGSAMQVCRIKNKFAKGDEVNCC